MTTTIKLTAFGTPTGYLTTELNSLANAGVVLGAAIDNTTNRHFYCKASISLASADLSAQTSPAVTLRLLESIDGGATYDDNDDKSYAITVPVAATSATHYKVSGDIAIPPGYFKLAVVNNTGVAFASSGNVVTYVTYTPEGV